MQSHPQSASQPAAFRKPSRSFANGNCVEVGEDWRKSRRCFSHHDCAEVGHAAGAVLVRDTKEAGHPHRTVLAFTPAAWQAFTAGLR